MTTCPSDSELRRHLESGAGDDSRDGPAAEGDSLAEHLAVCAACRGRLEALYREAMREAGGLLGHLPGAGVLTADWPPGPPDGGPEYRDRFPGDAGLIEAVFAAAELPTERASPPPPAPPAGAEAPDPALP
jgi:hypothetical protein